MNHRFWLYRCCLGILFLATAGLSLSACDDEETSTPPNLDADDTSGGADADPDTGTATTEDTSGADTSGADTTPTCSAETPICAPGCGSGEACRFDSGDCVCRPEKICDGNAPVCPGSGPNSGCAANEICDVQCECQPAVCNPDAPICDPGCGATDQCVAQGTACVCEAIPPPPPGLPRASRSSSVDITPDDGVVVMVNTDTGTVSVFDVATSGSETRRGQPVRSSLLSTASEPMTVVIHPDGARAFVANRATGSVSRIINIKTGTPTLDEEVRLGAEPMGLALSPSGDRLFVTDWVDGTVSVVNTANMTVERTIDVGGNPFAIAITNDLDADDTDEKAYVTQFFGKPRPGATQSEGTDDGRQGIVQVISLSTFAVTKEIPLAPLSPCFENAVTTSGCFPNQLFSITLHTAFGKTRAYVMSSASSPAGPTNFSHNVQALLSVIDTSTDTELPAMATNLNTLVKAQIDDDGDLTQGRRFLNTPSGLAFVNRDNAAIAYLTAAASDIVLRVQLNEDDSIQIGSPIALNIPVGQNPQGIVIKHGTSNATAFVGNLISRDLSLVSLADQRQTKTVEASTKPAQGTPEFETWKGKRFFNTSTGIWSSEGWGSCQGCHYLGLTDNVTFKFAAGPRQSISLDGQYAPNDPTDMRALNWTAVFDETHDFELNTRGVSGGKGTLQRADGTPINSGAGVLPFVAVNVDGTNTENHQALNGSLGFLAADPTVCANTNTCPDFGQIDAYIKTIRSPNGKTATDALIAQGRQVFQDGGCDKCHAGPKWTISSTFHDPTDSVGAPPTRTFSVNAAFGTAMDPTTLTTLGALPAGVNIDTTLIAGDDSGDNGATAGSPPFKRQACNVRIVGTFGADGGADETRDNGGAAQGQRGYNPPSLLGLSVGAPYLHNGAAADLHDLFDARFDSHTNAGSGLFIPTAAEIDALVAFLLSIDPSTVPFDIRPGTVLCPEGFTP
jgi:YVTN family beta-propeller protein